MALNKISSIAKCNYNYEVSCIKERKNCSKCKAKEKNRLMFLDKIKTVSISSKATPTRNKK